MTLSETLHTIREGAKQRIPEATRLIMERATDDLRTSGALDRVVKVGQRAPDFTLTSAAGTPVTLSDLLARGPVVLSFFRGRW